MSEPLQLFPPLDRATEAALRASIERFGVLVPVAEDQHRRILDGHHRARIARELGVKYRVDTIRVESDEQAREIAATLNTNRRPRLTGPQLREVMAALLNERRADGVGRHSVNAIAGALGISHQAAQKIEAQLATSCKLEPVTAREGQDGKVRPARRPTVIPALTETAAGRTAQAALNLPEDVEQPALDVKRAERLVREKAAADLRAKPAPAATTHGDIEIRHGDLRAVLDDLDGAVDAIITDPPYPAEFLPDWGALGELAARILAPDGVLAAMSGQLHVRRCMDELDRSIPYRWIGSYVTEGPATRVHAARFGTKCKPILIYGSTSRFVTQDLFVSRGREKRHHHWGQSESGIAQIVEAFTDPGDLVVDPFLGGGTTAVVCRGLGRRFVGCDIDPAAVLTTRERLAA